MDNPSGPWLTKRGYTDGGDTTLLAIQPIPQRSNRPAFWTGLSCAILLCGLTSGCHRRGYTDLYVDSMAAEIRDLEDQLYEYDHEYKLLEQELESLRRQAGQLRSAPPTVAPNTDREPLPPPSSKPRTNLPPSIIDKTEKLPTAPNIDLEEIEPELVVPQLNSQPSDPPPVTRQVPTLPSQPNNRSTDRLDDFDVERMAVPTINSGAALPPSVGPRDPSTAPEDDLDISLAQIELPTQLASSGPSARGATIHHATQNITDRRVVELVIQPNLSRAVNFDDDEQDDGLFLVLVPKNEQGQFVPTAASVTVEVYDPGRDDEHAQIGKWNYSPNEISTKIHPIGTQQGIHLTLPWNGPNPKADRVVVFVKYTFENGRQLVAHKEIFVNDPNTLKTVWAPRAGSSNYSLSSQEATSDVKTASGTRNATEPSRVQPTGRFPDGEFAPAPSRR